MWMWKLSSADSRGLSPQAAKPEESSTKEYHPPSERIACTELQVESKQAPSDPPRLKEQFSILFFPF